MSGIIDFRTEIEDENGASITEANPFPVTLSGLQVLQRIAALLKPLQMITGGGSNRLSVDVNSGSVIVSSGTITTVGTVTTVGNIASVGGVSAFDQVKSGARTAYNTGIRSRVN